MIAWSWVVVLLAILNYGLGALSANEAALLKSCWNAPYVATPNRFADWISGQPTRVYLEEVWWSPRNSGISLTIFTAATLDRLGMLEAQCRAYAGPLSAAVYVPQLVEGDPELRSNVTTDVGRRRMHQASSRDPVADARAKLQSLFERMENATGGVTTTAAGKEDTGSGCCCQLRLMLFTERVRDSALGMIMPVNVVRNAAMLGATTPLTAMLDVDLGANTALNSLVRNDSWIQSISQETDATTPAICIPPAWEASVELAKSAEALVVHTVHVALTGTKETLVWLWRKGFLEYFAEDICMHCHGSVNHEMWATAGKPYQATYVPGFEPWGILHRRRDPGYDERFRGWMGDKQTHVEALAQKHGFRFMVLPDVWLVHRPHKRAAISQIYQFIRSGGPSVSSDAQPLLQEIKYPNGTSTTVYKMYRSYAVSLRDEIRATLAMHGAAPEPYEPQLGPSYLNCKSVLPWWKW